MTTRLHVLGRVILFALLLMPAPMPAADFDRASPAESGQEGSPEEPEEVSSNAMGPVCCGETSSANASGCCVRYSCCTPSSPASAHEVLVQQILVALLTAADLRGFAVPGGHRSQIGQREPSRGEVLARACIETGIALPAPLLP